MVDYLDLVSNAIAVTLYPPGLSYLSQLDSNLYTKPFFSFVTSVSLRFMEMLFTS